ncbi:hypothetical protein B0H11DRAFT_1305410 [Mycena galericulata]|nr:hypothetical protein B0H11DRAFT_1305410 [Mycena galericulata]
MCRPGGPYMVVDFCRRDDFKVGSPRIGKAHNFESPSCMTELLDVFDNDGDLPPYAELLDVFENDGDPQQYFFALICIEFNLNPALCEEVQSAARQGRAHLDMDKITLPRWEGPAQYTQGLIYLIRTNISKTVIQSETQKENAKSPIAREKSPKRKLSEEKSAKNAWLRLVYTGLTGRGDLRTSQHLVELRIDPETGKSNKVNRKMTRYAKIQPMRLWWPEHVLRFHEDVFAPILYHAETVIMRLLDSTNLEVGGLNVYPLDRVRQQAISPAVICDIWMRALAHVASGRNLPAYRFMSATHVHHHDTVESWQVVLGGHIPKTLDGQEIAVQTLHRICHSKSYTDFTDGLPRMPFRPHPAPEDRAEFHRPKEQTVKKRSTAAETDSPRSANSTNVPARAAPLRPSIAQKRATAVAQDESGTRPISVRSRRRYGQGGA